MDNLQPYGGYNQQQTYPGGYTPGSTSNANQAYYQTNQPSDQKYQTYGQPVVYTYKTKH